MSKLSKRQREIQEEHRWYEKNFPASETKRKRSPMWIMEIDIRDTKILVQRREIRRLKRRLEEAKAEFKLMKSKRDALEARQGAPWAKVPDLLDDITHIAPIEAAWPHGSILPKVSSKHIVHEWRIDRTIGWWWHIPYGWWLKLKKQFQPGGLFNPLPGDEYP